MKKLSLVLGSLLVVGAVASAKEVKPAPVVAPQVKVIEKEVIIYKESEKGSGKVKGHVKVEFEKELGAFTWTKGTKEEKNEAGDVTTPEVKSTSGYSSVDGPTELVVSGKVEFAPKHELNFKAKTADALRLILATKDKEIQKTAVSTELGYAYKYGEIGTSGIKATPSVKYSASTGKTKEKAAFAVEFANANNLLESGIVKKMDFSLTPKYTLGSLINPPDVHIQAKHTVDVDAKLTTTFVEDIKLVLKAGYKWDPKHNDNLGISTMSSKLSADLSKEFELYNQNDVTVTLEPSIGAKDAISFAKDADDKLVVTNAWGLKAALELGANYKATESVDVYGKLSSELESTKFEKFPITQKATAGFKVSF